MKIFLFRHGEIENPKQLLPGRLPGFRLSQQGRENVIKTAATFKNEDIKMIYTSPLERTMETAEIIADAIGLDPEKIKKQNEIIEVESPKWQGRKSKEFKEESEYIKNPNVTSDMEGRKDSGKRVFNFLQEIAKKNENAVVVSHGDPIMGAIGYITGKWEVIDKSYIKRGKYYTVEIDGDKWKVDLRD